MRTRTLLSGIAAAAAVAVTGTLVAAPAASAATPPSVYNVVHAPGTVSISTSGTASNFGVVAEYYGSFDDIAAVDIQIFDGAHRKVTHRQIAGASARTVKANVIGYVASFAPNGRTWKPGKYQIKVIEYSRTGHTPVTATSTFAVRGRSDVTLDSSVASFRGSANTLISGHLIVGGQRTAGQKIAIQTRGSARGTWRTVYTVRTGANGHYQHSYHLTGPIQFRAVLAASTYIGGAVSGVTFYS